MVRVSDRYTEGHGFDSRRGLRFFSLSQARDMLNIPSFLNSESFFKKYHRAVSLRDNEDHSCCIKNDPGKKIRVRSFL